MNYLITYKNGKIRSTIADDDQSLLKRLGNELREIETISGTYTLEYDMSYYIENNLCPICGEKPMGNCKCPRRDSYCSNGHWWHTCVVHNIVILGASDHSMPTNICTCNRIKKTFY